MFAQEEVARAVLERHGYATAEKFVQEVAWRTYWKGWLEHRPAVLTRYSNDLLSMDAPKLDKATLARLEKAWVSWSWRRQARRICVAIHPYETIFQPTHRI